MSGTIAAVAGAAVLGATVTAVEANQAQKASEKANNDAINAQKQALTSQQQIAQPYVDLGTANLPTYQQLLTGGGGPDAGKKIEDTLQSLPGYQATLDQGIEAAKRSSAASGLNLSGNQVAGVEAFGTQLADSTYSQRLNELLQPVQIGQGAAAGQAANIGATGQQVSSLINQQGQTNAAIGANEVAGITKAAQGGANNLITYQTLQNLNSNPGSNPSNLGGSNPAAAPGSALTYDPYGNITGSVPIAAGGTDAVAVPTYGAPA